MWNKKNSNNQNTFWHKITTQQQQETFPRHFCGHYITTPNKHWQFFAKFTYPQGTRLFIWAKCIIYVTYMTDFSYYYMSRCHTFLLLCEKKNVDNQKENGEITPVSNQRFNNRKLYTFNTHTHAYLFKFIHIFIPG